MEKFVVKIEESHDKKYLKIEFSFDIDNEKETIDTFLNSLNSVRKANLNTRNFNKHYFIVYPNDCFSIEEVKQDVESSLKKLLAGK